MNRQLQYYLTTIIGDSQNKLMNGGIISLLHKIIQSFSRLRIKTLKFWAITIFTSLLFIVLGQFNIDPVRSQLINIPESLPQEQSFDTVHVGNLDVGKIWLDGQVLFSVAAPTSDVSDSSKSTSAIERRVKTIQFHLSDIVKRGFDPDTLKVTKSILNNQTILVASDKDWGPRNILTVTAFDVELDEPGTIDEIAQRWAKTIEQALLQAHEQRQPAYQKQQIPFVLTVFTAMILISFVLIILQKFRATIQHRLEQFQGELEAKESQESKLNSDSTPADKTLLVSSHKLPRHGLRRLFPQLTVDQQLSLTLIAHRVLIAVQILIWFGGIAIIFHRFPQTRAWGDWLLRIPLAYIAIPLGIGIVKSVVDSLIRWYLKTKVNNIEAKGSSSVRLRARALSIFHVLEELTGYLALVFGFLLFFYIIKAFSIALIAIAITAFIFKSTLEDFIQTYFLLSEDQYALGDVVQLGSITGKVEKISLRSSQVRALCGDLFTIPHSSFNEVTNFTHEYSGIFLKIDVAYKTDLNQAMAVIEEVAQQMQRDTLWRKYIISSQMKGVETFGDNSITIGLVLKTETCQQWDVGREYRRRLKPAFDQAGIEIPFPQRSIWFENPLMTDEKMTSK